MRLLLAMLASLLLCLGLLAQPAPYRCGFVLESLDAIRKVYAPELKALDLRPGESIAEVGGSNGYRLAMFAALYDSLDLWVEDIDTLCLNESELQAVIAWHEKLRGSPLNSQLHLVVGDTLATQLPEAYFDRVMLTASYHHLSHPEAMLRDIATKLKPQTGRLYLVENIVRRDGARRRRLCNDPLVSEATLRRQVESAGWQVLAIHSLGRWWTKMLVLQPTTPALP